MARHSRHSRHDEAIAVPNASQRRSDRDRLAGAGRPALADRRPRSRRSATPPSRSARATAAVRAAASSKRSSRRPRLADAAADDRDAAARRARRPTPRSRARARAGQPRLARLEQARRREQLRRAGAAARGAARRRPPWAARLHRVEQDEAAEQQQARDRRSSPPSAARAAPHPARLSRRRSRQSAHALPPPRARAPRAWPPTRACQATLGLGQPLEPRRDRPGDAEGEDQAVERGQHRRSPSPGPSRPGSFICANIPTRPITVPIMPIAGATSAAGRQTPIAPAWRARAVLELLARPERRRRRRLRRRRAGRRRDGRTRPASCTRSAQTMPLYSEMRSIRRTARVGGDARPAPGRAREQRPERGEGAARRRRRSPDTQVASSGAADDEERRREGRRNAATKSITAIPPAARQKSAGAGKILPVLRRPPSSARAPARRPQTWHDHCIEQADALACQFNGADGAKI